MDNDPANPANSENTPPDLDALLSWDEEANGKPPVEAVPLSELRDYIQRRDGTLIDRAREETRAEFEERSRRERENTERLAAAQSDIEWAAKIDADLSSTDEAVRASALAAKEEDRDRYLRGLAMKFQRDKGTAAQGVLAEHYRELLGGVQKADVSDLLEALKSADRLNEHGGNPLLLAHAMGKAAGDAVGYARGLEEGERKARTEENANGAPSLRGGDNTKKGLTDGITLGAPGSTRELRKRFAASAR